MAFPFLPSKRPYERNMLEPTGRGKMQKMASFNMQQNSPKMSSGPVMLRFLCPNSKSGSVIGKGGGNVAKIRQETGAKIKLEEVVPGCEERVVVITVMEKDMEISKEQSKEENEEAIPKEADGADVDDTAKKVKENDDVTEDSSAVEGLKMEKLKSSAVKALILIFERIVEGDAENDKGEASEDASTVSMRLLVLSNQVGCLLGKGGSIIKQMSADSGAQIRVLPRDKLPLCATPLEEILQITGGTESVKKALQSVAQQLLDNPPRGRDTFPPIAPGPSSHTLAPMPRSEGFPPTNYHLPAQEPPFGHRPFDGPEFHPRFAPPFPQFHEGGPHGQPQFVPDILTFRLLCQNDKVGSVIGKGGSIIRALQGETGCEVKVLETNPESDDRIIVISGPAVPSDSVTPVQDAVMRVQHRIMMSAPDNEGSNLTRLLIASTQTGCLLGKGGSIITEIRKASGAHIRILTKDQLPKSVPENDELVQISGEFPSVQEAIFQITNRLKHHFFREKPPSLDPNSHPPFGEQLPPYGSFMGRREPSPSRLHSNMPPFQKDSVGHPYDERPAYGHVLHGPGGPHNVERDAPWITQGAREIGGPMPLLDYPGGGPQRRFGGFSGGNQPSFIKHTTIDVIVPRSAVPSIYGEDGGCLRRICEISEAKITITEPRPESKETLVIISGTMEQTHAAQSLIQAFVLSESGAP